MDSAIAIFGIVATLLPIAICLIVGIGLIADEWDEIRSKFSASSRNQSRPISDPSTPPSPSATKGIN